MKRLIALILILCTSLFTIGCSKDASDSSDTSTTADDVVVEANQTDVSIGDTITVKITLNNLTGVKSVAIRPVFDEESFSVVNSRNLAGGIIADNSNGMVSSLFAEEKSMNGAAVAEFIIKANAVGNGKTIAFTVSALGANDTKIDVKQADNIQINVKY